MVVGIGDNDVVLSVDGDAGRFGKLTFHHAEFAKLAMINHLLPLNLS